jgi:serine/threonine protein kinase
VRGPPITDFSSLASVQELGSSRFGVVRLLQRLTTGGVERFAAKFYHPGANRDPRAFESVMGPFLELSHPRVMPIAGFISPTQEAGPVILSPYHASGSLEGVLNRVRRNDPPAFWTAAGKARVIAGLLSGLFYLHSSQMFPGDLKPSAVILDSNRSPLICDFMTATLESSKFTSDLHAGSPSYAAPDVSGGDAAERPAVFFPLALSSTNFSLARSFHHNGSRMDRVSGR